MIKIRPIKINLEDAEAFLALRRRLDAETTFMMLEPGERTTTLEEQRRQIAEALASPNSALLVAEDDGALVGYLSASGGRYRRERHRAYLVIGILQAYTRQGIGTRLFTELERWARERGIHRLELTAMTHNTAAIALYKKMGFEIEGVKRHSLRVGGAYVDEYLMAKLLG